MDTGSNVNQNDSTALHCKEKNYMAKGQLELKLDSTLGDNKKGIFKYVNSKRC